MRLEPRWDNMQTRRLLGLAADNMEAFSWQLLSFLKVLTLQ